MQKSITTTQPQLSNCCDAPINHQDQNGHGKCTDCGDNCTPYRKPRKRKWKLVFSTSQIILFWIILFLTSCATPKFTSQSNTQRELTPNSGFIVDAVFYDQQETIVFTSYYRLSQTGHTAYINGENWQSETYNGKGQNHNDGKNEITFKITEEEYYDFKTNYDDIRLTLSIPHHR